MISLQICLGVQEYIEAFSFYHYLKDGKLVTFREAVDFIIRHFDDSSLPKDKVTLIEHGLEESENQSSLEKMMIDGDNPGTEILKIQNQDISKVNVYNHNIVTMVDYVLGLNDLSGELMRYCINKISSGCLDTAFDICRFLSHLYVGMLSVGFVSREYNRKMITVKQCLSKVELACYTVRVRGSEIPKHMIVSVLENVNDETEDEMY